MALKRICDRCGEEIPKSHDFFTIEVKPNAEIGYMDANPTIEKSDMCITCAHVIKRAFVTK